MARQEHNVVVWLDDVSAILTDVQCTIRRIVQEVKSSYTTEPTGIQVHKCHRICTSSDESSDAITDKGSTSMEDGLSESGKSFYIFTFW